MTDEIRMLFAVLLFSIGVYLVWDLFATGFDFVVLVSSISCFIMAHYVKPKSRDGDELSYFWDFLDFIVDLPFKVIAAFLRAISRPFKGDIDGVDL